MVITARRAAAATAAALSLIGAGPNPGDRDLVGFTLPTIAWLPKSARRPTAGSSYRITVTASNGERFVGIEDGPRRYKLVRIRGGERTETYFIGPIVYQYFRREGWLKIDTVRMMRSAAAHGFHPRKSPVDEREPPLVVRELPDRHVKGVLTGAVRFTARAWSPEHRSYRRRLVTMTCLYAKEGPEYESCTAGNLFTVRFDRYGDPTNHFVVPRAALDAPLAPWSQQ
ncbi:MAG: hypothetical protein JO083_01250 [Candidatus Eremiobacteraeota bacterium]|nr:hypothetical protein [Candidatus Eremiobacteraeota bacterium]